MRKHNALSDGQKIKLWDWLRSVQTEAEADSWSAVRAAKRATQELGFSVTHENVRGAVEAGVVPAFTGKDRVGPSARLKELERRVEALADAGGDRAGAIDRLRQAVNLLGERLAAVRADVDGLMAAATEPTRPLTQAEAREAAVQDAATPEEPAPARREDGPPPEANGHAPPPAEGARPDVRTPRPPARPDVSRIAAAVLRVANKGDAEAVAHDKFLATLTGPQREALLSEPVDIVPPERPGPQSFAVFRDIVGRLPVRWKAGSFTIAMGLTRSGGVLAWTVHVRYMKCRTRGRAHGEAADRVADKMERIARRAVEGVGANAGSFAGVIGRGDFVGVRQLTGLEAAARAAKLDEPPAVAS